VGGRVVFTKQGARAKQQKGGELCRRTSQHPAAQARARRRASTYSCGADTQTKPRQITPAPLKGR